MESPATQPSGAPARRPVRRPRKPGDESPRQQMDVGQNAPGACGSSASLPPHPAPAAVSPRLTTPLPGPLTSPALTAPPQTAPLTSKQQPPAPPPLRAAETAPSTPMIPRLRSTPPPDEEVLHASTPLPSPPPISARGLARYEPPVACSTPGPVELPEQLPPRKESSRIAALVEMARTISLSEVTPRETPRGAGCSGEDAALLPSGGERSHQRSRLAKMMHQPNPETGWDPSSITDSDKRSRSLRFRINVEGSEATVYLQASPHSTSPPPPPHTHTHTHTRAHTHLISSYP